MSSAGPSVHSTTFIGRFNLSREPEADSDSDSLRLRAVMCQCLPVAVATVTVTRTLKMLRAARVSESCVRSFSTSLQQGQV
jgi:hypothetical protein